jgi:hypothetical protein
MAENVVAREVINFLRWMGSHDRLLLSFNAYLVKAKLKMVATGCDRHVLVVLHEVGHGRCAKSWPVLKCHSGFPVWHPRLQMTRVVTKRKTKPPAVVMVPPDETGSADLGVAPGKTNPFIQVIR